MNHSMMNRESQVKDGIVSYEIYRDNMSYWHVEFVTKSNQYHDYIFDTYSQAELLGKSLKRLIKEE